MAANLDDRRRFWDSFIRAAEAEPRNVDSIRGASGLSHPVLAVGVDKARRRLIMISGEADGRSAALAQADIQASMRDVNVVMARAVPINLGAAAKLLGDLLGGLRITAQHLALFKSNESARDDAAKKRVTSIVEEAGQFTLRPFEYATLSAISAWKEVIQQLALVEMSNEGAKNDPTAWAFGLEKLAALDPSEYDRRMGVCTIPLYEISSGEAEQFQRGADIEAVRAILANHDILQYFFPSADQLSLGLVERAPQDLDSLIETVAKVPGIGHPLGAAELVKPHLNLADTIAELREQGLVVEGEAGLEVSAAGSSIRSVVRFKPREGLLSKISNLISIKFDITLKDLFKP